MHLVETYATNCGLRIDKPFILEKYFPITQDKYITFHPFSKPAKNYSYWQTVLDLILPPLEKEGIEILQIGSAGDHEFAGCIGLSGSTTTGQVAYLMKDSLLHLGCDSFPVHIASAYDKKMVITYPMTHVENVGPYWGDTKNHSILVGRHGDDKPNFALEESPQTIDSLRPEKIAKEICRLLGLDLDFPYETVYVGESFNNRSIENVPNQVVNPRDFNVESIIERMDLNFSEELLDAQLQRSKCSIVTDRPINRNIIQANKANILQVLYIVTEDDDSSFAQYLENMAVNYSLISKLPQEEINDKRVNYMNLENAAIMKINTPKREDIKEIENEDLNKLYYISSKALLSRKAVYSSEADMEMGDVTTHFTCPKTVKDVPVFWENINKFLILKKVD